jgi:hypothetical protein
MCPNCERVVCLPIRCQNGAERETKNALRSLRKKRLFGKEYRRREKTFLRAAEYTNCSHSVYGSVTFGFYNSST